MSSTKNVLIGACCMGAVAISCLFLAVGYIINEIQTVGNELDVEIAAFKMKASDLWKDLLSMNISRRQRRQYPESASNAVVMDSYNEDKELNAAPKGPSQSDSYDTEASSPRYNNEELAIGENLDEKNICPAGPPGPQGENGLDGMDGVNGTDGLDGKHADDVQAQMQQYESCFHCPPGPPGKPGQPGHPGPRGMRGSPGRSGSPGHDGQPGPPGQMGINGLPGPTGEQGKQGEPGIDYEHVVGVPGIKGTPGSPGPVGEQGDVGEPGQSGPEGPIGERGPHGEKGDNGEQGEPGDPGEEGMPGSDAEYCPCPGRTSVINNPIGHRIRSDGISRGNSPAVESNDNFS